MTVKEEEWRKRTIHGVTGADFVWPDALLVTSQC